MGQYLSPGVFVEEVPSQVQVVQAVSTSNMGIVGFTSQGPTDTATLVTSFDQFQKTFGGFVRESFLPLSVAAFFANGGQRAYVVRVVPADAVAADAKMQSLETDQQIETGDGTTVAFTRTVTTSLLKDHSGASPILSGSVSFRYRGAGTPTTVQDLRNRANAAALLQVNMQAIYEGRINPATLVGAYSGGVLLDSAQFAVVPGTATLSWQPDAVAARTIAIPVGSAPFEVTTTVANGNGSIVTLDHITGFVSIKFVGTDVPGSAAVGNIQMSFTATNATKTIVDSTGALTGASLTAPGTISYTDGSYSFTTSASTNVPHNKAPILATYKINAWDLTPVSKGVWGNSLRVDVVGDPDFQVPGTASFSAYNVSVLLENATTGAFEVQESYDGLVFSDPTSADFFADVLNELSDYVRVAEPGGNEAPCQLKGISRHQIIAGGSELSAGQTIAATTNYAPIAPRSVTITYNRASDGLLRTITDDGVGNLVGNVDATGTNTINYTTGAISLKTLETIQATTLVKVAYYTAPTEITHSELFGDSTKSYTSGSDGTFDSAHFSRDQFTTPGTLQANYAGLYALDRVDEIMQVAIPDFAGDVTVTGDLLDYADDHAAAASGGDRFIILTVPKGSSAQEATNWFRYTLGRFSNFAALYWPWVRVADPLSNNRALTMPALGHVAGVYARTDSTKNVGKSPGGTVDGALKFLLGLELTPTQGERDSVYPNKVNPLISSPQTGLAVWGVRTIAQDTDWRYINARRLFMFLEKSIYNATAWIVFENNGTALWGRIKAQLNGFLGALYTEGYFAGSTPTDAFFVKVDNTNNTADTIDQGLVIIDIGIAPNKPAEFVVMRFTQVTQQA